MSRWIPAFVHELSDAESAAAFAAMPKHARDELERLAKAEPNAERADKAKRPRYRITGIASTEHRDKQGDVIRQQGLDWKPFLQSGYINDDHGKGANCVIGYPTAVRKMTLRGPKGEAIPATAIDGYLFDVERAAELAKLAKAMEGTERQMGFSVEGPPPQRASNDPNEIVGATITHVALTPWPVNPNALAVVTMANLAKSFAKAMTAGSGVAEPNADVPGSTAPLIVQDLVGAGRRKKRHRISTKDAMAQLMAVVKAATNSPAGKHAAEKEKRMTPREFLKGKHPKMGKLSDEEALKFAKAVGYAPEGDDDDDFGDDDDMEKGVDQASFKALLKGLNAAINEKGSERSAGFGLTDDALNGLAKSGSAERDLFKSLVGDIKGVVADSVRASNDAAEQIHQAMEVSLYSGQIVAGLAKSLDTMTARIGELEATILQATSRPAAPKAVAAKPVPRFGDDAAPGDLAKSGAGHPLAGMSRDALGDALTKGVRDAYGAGNGALGDTLSSVVFKLSQPRIGEGDFTPDELAAVNKIVKG